MLADDSEMLSEDSRMMSVDAEMMAKDGRMMTEDSRMMTEDRRMMYGSPPGMDKKLQSRSLWIRWEFCFLTPVNGILYQSEIADSQKT